MGRIVTFGEIMLRLSPKGSYRLLQNEELLGTFGGAEANVAVSLANWGEKVSFVSKLPDNLIGQRAISCLRSFGVDTDQIAIGGDRIGIYYLEKGANQRKSICIYDRKYSSFSGSELTDYDWDQIFADADHFHFTGITPALGQNIYELCLQACIAAKKKGAVISCDLNYRTKLWTQAQARAAMTELCKYVDVCIMNEEDARSVFGIEAAGTDIVGGKIRVEGYHHIAAQLQEMFGFKYVAFTLRSSYSASHNDWMGVLYDDKTHYLSRSYQITDIIDRVGGGDSFGAGLIYGLRHFQDKQHIIEYAVAASALKHSIEGDFNLVSVSEVEALAAGDASGRIQR